MVFPLFGPTLPFFPTKTMSLEKYMNQLTLEKSMQLAPLPFGAPVLPLRPLRAPAASRSPLRVQTKSTALWVSTTAGLFSFEDIWRKLGVEMKYIEIY